MDLPLPQLNQSNIELNDGTISIQHHFNKTLLTLTPEHVFGKYHILARNQQGQGVLLRIDSRFSFDTLNVHTLESRLRTVLDIVSYGLITIGLVYECNNIIYIGDRALEIKNGIVTI